MSLPSWTQLDIVVIIRNATYEFTILDTTRYRSITDYYYYKMQKKLSLGVDG